MILCCAQGVLWSLLQLSGVFQIGGGGIGNLQARFERIVERGTAVERTAGMVYFTLPDRLHVVTFTPTWQHLVVDNRAMTIYYPLENKVLVVRSERAFELPFLPVFLLGLRRDYGLSEQGYVLTDHRLNGDTLETDWRRKARGKEAQPVARLRSIGRKILSMEVQDSTRHTWSKLMFDTFVRTPDSSWIAARSLATKQTVAGMFRETIALKEVRFNTPFPDSIGKFQIPPSATVTESQW